MSEPSPSTWPAILAQQPMVIEILSDYQRTVEVESTKYPFCFYGDPKTPDATTGVIEFFPFND